MPLGASAAKLGRLQCPHAAHATGVSAGLPASQGRASMACWKMAGVVSEEKVTVLAPISSGGQRPARRLGRRRGERACRGRCAVSHAGAAGVRARLLHGQHQREQVLVAHRVHRRDEQLRKLGLRLHKQALCSVTCMRS